MATAPSDYALQEEFVATDQYEVGEAVSLWHDTWRRMRRNRLAVAATAFVLFVILVAIVAQFWTPYPIWRQGLGPTYQAPTLKHPLGLDQSGRDILSRLMGGAEISMEVGIGTALLSSVIGIMLGLLAGFYRGWVDNLISLIINVWYGIPDLLVVMMFVVVTQRRELLFTIVAISIPPCGDIAPLGRGPTPPP